MNVVMQLPLYEGGLRYGQSRELAEDAARQARLDLLVASGAFPR